MSRKRRKQKATLEKIGRVLVLTFFFLLVILPIYWMIITSLKTHQEIINVHEITLFPKKITFENYQLLFKMLNYGQFLKNSLVLSLSTCLVVVTFSIFGGYALARYNFKGKNAILLFFLATQMIPGMLVMIPMYTFYAKIGLLDTSFPLLFFYIAVNLPFCVITTRSFFERIPVSLEEAAQVDGCSRLAAVFRIIIPVMFPGIVAVFVFAFTGSWNDLIAGVIFTNNQELWTIPVGLKTLIGKYDVKWGALMAGGTLALLPTGIMFIFVQRFIVDGLTAGAVKG